MVTQRCLVTQHVLYTAFVLIASHGVVLHGVVLHGVALHSVVLCGQF